MLTWHLGIPGRDLCESLGIRVQTESLPKPLLPVSVFGALKRSKMSEMPQNCPKTPKMRLRRPDLLRGAPKTPSIR